jgi:hypothetical protein
MRPPRGCGFDRCPALHDRHQRDHAGMWEIDVLDLLPDVVQHSAALERDRSQMGCQQRKVMRRQCRQETVELSLLELPGSGGGAGRHRWRSCFKTAILVRRSSQVKICLSDSALVQRIDLKINQSILEKVPLARRGAHQTTLYPRPGSRTRCGGERRAGLVAARSA